MHYVIQLVALLYTSPDQAGIQAPPRCSGEEEPAYEARSVDDWWGLLYTKRQ